MLIVSVSAFYSALDVPEPQVVPLQVVEDTFGPHVYKMVQLKLSTLTQK